MARKTRGLLSICFKGVYMISFKKICKLVFSFLITALVLFSYFHLNEVSALVVDENLISENENKVDYYEFVDSLKNAYSNDDIVGKIRIDGTTDFRIRISHDKSADKQNDYKNYNIAGSLFVDSRVNLDDDKKILIYGHNSPKGDRPFSVLEEYYDYEYSRGVNIQVTDLGVTARAGYDKVVALVKKLSDDSPVENAKVYLYQKL